MKEKILKILLILLSILIVIYVTFIIYNKFFKATIEGTWESTERQSIINGQENELEKNEGYIIKFLKNNELKLCYYVDNEVECGTTRYKYQDGILFIEDNEWYLKGKYEVLIEDDTLNLTYIYNDNNIVRLYFRKGKI